MSKKESRHKNYNKNKAGFVNFAKSMHNYTKSSYNKNNFLGPKVPFNQSLFNYNKWESKESSFKSFNYETSDKITRESLLPSKNQDDSFKQKVKRHILQKENEKKGFKNDFNINSKEYFELYNSAQKWPDIRKSRQSFQSPIKNCFYKPYKIERNFRMLFKF